MSKIKVLNRIILSGADEIASECLSQDEVAEPQNNKCNFIQRTGKPVCCGCRYELFDPISGKSYCSVSNR